MNDHVWDTSALSRSAPHPHPRGPGRYVGTRWQPAGLPTAVRVTLQAAVLAAAVLLLTGFYNVVRGAVARGPAVSAPAPAAATAAPADIANAAAPGTWDCGAARQAVCTRLAPQATAASARPGTLALR